MEIKVINYLGGNDHFCRKVWLCTSFILLMREFCAHTSYLRHSYVIDTLHCRNGGRSENLGGQVVMRRAASVWRRLLFCQNLGGGVLPPAPHLPPCLIRDVWNCHKIRLVKCTLSKYVSESSTEYIRDILLFLLVYIMAIRVVEFSNGGYKIRKIFA